VLIMTSMKWMVAAALFAMSAGALADGTYEFDSVTSLKSDGAGFTGVLVNDTAPTTITLSSGGASGQCFDWLQLMMTQPGTLTVTVTVTTVAGPFQSTILISGCTLNAKP
jgi:hypothetical protein